MTVSNSMVAFIVNLLYLLLRAMLNSLSVNILTVPVILQPGLSIPQVRWGLSTIHFSYYHRINQNEDLQHISNSAPSPHMDCCLMMYVKYIKLQ